MAKPDKFRFKLIDTHRDSLSDSVPVSISRRWTGAGVYGAETKSLPHGTAGFLSSFVEPSVVARDRPADR